MQLCANLCNSELCTSEPLVVLQLCNSPIQVLAAVVLLVAAIIEVFSHVVSANSASRLDAVLTLNHMNMESSLTAQC